MKEKIEKSEIDLELVNKEKELIKQKTNLGKSENKKSKYSDSFEPRCRVIKLEDGTFKTEKYFL